jgi:hypothetical protein
MPRKAPAKKSQPTASKKEASNVKASSKNRPAKLKRSAPASKSKSSGNSIDALVKKQLTSLRQADTLFKDAVSIVEIYRKKHPELISIFLRLNLHSARSQFEALPAKTRIHITGSISRLLMEIPDMG